MTHVVESPLGKSAIYIDTYTPGLLFPISRHQKRNELHIDKTLPFFGVDLWNGYELSWLNPQGKPIVAIAQFEIPCESPNLIESKSFKLYLNSFNQTQFNDVKQVTESLKRDLSAKTGANVNVKIFSLAQFNATQLENFKSISLDDLDIETNAYQINPNFLVTENKFVQEVVHSDLLKSNCLVTGQPDWASIEIEYTGKKINHAGLLKYLISYRQHQEFHEQCIERIFMDIMRYCAPEQLTIEGRFTRRGGLDINPLRTTDRAYLINPKRMVRQ